MNKAMVFGHIKTISYKQEKGKDKVSFILEHQEMHREKIKSETILCKGYGEVARYMADKRQGDFVWVEGKLQSDAVGGLVCVLVFNCQRVKAA